MSHTDETIIAEVRDFFLGTITPKLVARCENEALKDIRNGTGPKEAFRKSGCYYNCYHKSYKRIVRAHQRRIARRKTKIATNKQKKKAKKTHEKHRESVQQYRHELNRTVTDLRKSEKHIKQLEETVARLEKRFV